MKNLAYISLMICLLSQISYGQTHSIKSGALEILAVAPLDTVSAISEKPVGSLDMKSKRISFSCAIESFIFEDQLILTNLSRTILNVKEHPTLNFEGAYRVKKKEREVRDDGQTIIINGVLTINGVPQELSVDAILIESKEKVNVSLKTIIDLNDHKVSIPSLLRDALSNEIEVSLDIDMIPTSNDKSKER